MDSSNENDVIRSQAKKSTNLFYSYVSLFIINKNDRFNVSVLSVELNNTKAIASYFMDLINKLNLMIKVLCLDREFNSIYLVELLQNEGIPFITPVVRNGKEIKQMFIGRKGRYAEYIMTNLLKKKILLNIVICIKYLKGKRSKKDCGNFGFVVYGVNCSLRKVSNVFRRRFAIELSYSIRYIVKPKTSKQYVIYRYFLH